MTARAAGSVTTTALLAREAVAAGVFTWSAIAIYVSSGATGSTGLLGIAVGNAAALGVAMSVWSADVNPAVTLARAPHRPGFETALRLAAQLAGALIAGLAVRAMYTPVQWQPTMLGSPAPLGGSSAWRVGVIEAAAAFVLALTVAVSARHGSRVFAAMSGGATLGVVTLIAGPITGGGVHSFRSLASALWSGSWDYQTAFIVGPLVGGLVAAGAVHGMRLAGARSGVDDASAPRGGVSAARSEAGAELPS